jgi:2-polyprenyl-6-methoxyphenol hydroxylase-like FAD-dependent oxidoreductase
MPTHRGGDLASFEDGTAAVADLLIDADGINSATRRAVDSDRTATPVRGSIRSIRRPAAGNSDCELASCTGGGRDHLDVPTPAPPYTSLVMMKIGRRPKS